jgi:hypothetical protein
MPVFAQKCSQIEGQYEHFLCLSPLDGQFLDRFLGHWAEFQLRAPSAPTTQSVGSGTA